jgi:Zn-dependent membrane protease YugP
MAIVILLGAALFLGLIFGPQYWVRQVMRKHAAPREDYPGTGGELARHLLDEAGLQSVTVEKIAAGDHYSPAEKVVRLSKDNFDGKSITAVAVAAHEVAHAVQDRDGYRPLQLRQKLVGYAHTIEMTGSILLMATPLVFALVRSPVVLAVELVAGLGILASTVVIHAVTLPTEFDASFNRALPALSGYIHRDDLPAARQVLKAAAFTYLSAALVSLLDIARWIRLLRF